MGLLTMTGTIDLAQFWPQGDSDADTAKIGVHVTGASSFTFQAGAGGPAKPTAAFIGASVKVKGKPKPVIDSKGRVTVRFQGTDAPELHFAPTFGMLTLRQNFGEASTSALGAMLRAIGPGPLACRVITQVNHPNDVFDMFGRFIGDILVKKSKSEININHWTVEQGWAFPSFYNSMTSAEIQAVLTLAEAARKARRNIWSAGAFTQNLGTLDMRLIYRKKGAAPAPDKGAVINPKFFRRQYRWRDSVAKGKSTAKTLKQYLQGVKPPDQYMLTAEVLASSSHSATVHNLADAINAANTVTVAPKDLVYREAGSTLVKGAGNTPVTTW